MKEIERDESSSITSAEARAALQRQVEGPAIILIASIKPNEPRDNSMETLQDCHRRGDIKTPFDSRRNCYLRISGIAD